ncbi:TPA: replication-relaxation family protein [Streptococcus suis]|uniref:replication-relaxation family protein n=1 Tax=Streptococcus suis TaxID=1307 RepID=UPI0004264787|nr:replication-relaxation family protein [Streptococcus suis]NQL51692.1 replication-relaxation family protein [Streptococcus suis]WNF76618.1 replication-relaxation family protein [Streptococcus suis]HEM2910815.1 replication-relaxation family protein [Streptococcus suis]HEM3187165.1 replication-relaxation family protein [Streptococcus suis 89-2479]HEM3708780.1 replication-relaxation family protein [Streptococcus suis]
MKWNQLTANDIAILHFLNQARLATTHQLARLFYSDSPSPETAIRRANFTTQRLKKEGLISHLDRRIGGARKGSASYVWQITFQGLKVLKGKDSTIALRYKNRYEPTQHHVEHTLAITEIFVETIEVARSSDTISLENFSFEPTSWRDYQKLSGVGLTLKPDAYLELLNGEYEDHYFLEIDRSTESLARVVNTCKKYIEYYRSGIEQRQKEVFPYVLWIVPDDKRKTAILKAIQNELYNFWELFTVITLDEYQSYIKGGLENESEE